MSRILLTGANGFVASHILHQLLASGSSVRAVVRSQAKADRVRADLLDARGQLDFAIVPDIAAAGAFDSTLASVPPFDVVIHTASPFLYSAASKNTDFLDPAVQGTRQLLLSIKRHAPTVKRVVMTSSCAAVVDFDLPVGGGKVYTSEDWNPVTWDEAVTTTNLSTAYRASKKYAELAAWDFIRDEAPQFDLVTLCPPMVYGPLQHTINKIADLNESNSRIWNLFISSSKDAPLPPNGVHLFVDVRDLARAHILATSTPAAANKRMIIAGAKVSSQEISDILRGNFPSLADTCPRGSPGVSSLPSDAYTADVSPAKEILGLEFRDVASTFVELAQQLIAIGHRTV
ncbi:hypothetical protein BJX63DRAFT_433237 [Aspergillus granulosus]|uniref:NAD-dependent epimerase/dehydratase domain-containing protein n=1 Tax=Aspergillus granulosus TaxID=176169 RepID=A0ABR4H8B6_9EURO